jgi:hypothetical protein
VTSPGHSYGGYKESGIGREFSLEGMLESYTQSKKRHGQSDALGKAQFIDGLNCCSSQEAQMVIARMLIRGGLFTLALTAGMATAKAICRIMRSPSLPDAEPQRTRSERVGNRPASKSRRRSNPPRSAEPRRA